MLIGREAERRAIEGLVAGARVGTSGVLLITGEPGIGKTALVDEAATLADGLRVLRARGAEAEQAIPFGGLLQLLRPALGELDRIPAPQRDALAAALALGSGADVDRFAVGAATLSLLCRYAEPAPVAVLVDDAHLLDRPSAEAVLFAARRLFADPIVLLIAARSDSSADGGAVGSHLLAAADLPRLRLGGLDLAAAQQLVRSRAVGAPARSHPRTDLAPRGQLAASHSAEQLGAERSAEQFIPVDLVARLHRTVAGNPLALLELTSDPEHLQRVAPGVPVPVPALLAEAFAARADRLSPAARTALLVASVEDGDLGIVARACAELEVDVAALAEAEHASLVSIAAGRVEFRHPLVRSAVYASAAAADRRTVHGAVAAALAGYDADRRAWHLSETVLGTDDEVALAMDVAAEHAVERGAHAIAATAYERAARLTEGLQERAVRLVAAGRAGWSAGMPERADALLDEALALEPPVPVRAQADEVRGDIAAKCGSPVRARDILTAAAGEVADPAVAIGLLSDVVNACFLLGDAADGLRAADEIDGLLDRVENPSARILGLLASGVAKVLAGRNGTDQIREAVALAPSVELVRDRRRQIWMVLAPLFLRETGTGRALLKDAMREGRDQVGLGTLPALLFQLARDDATTDRWADAASSYDEGARLSRETGQTTALAICLAGQAWLAAHRGREQECRELAAEAIEICTERQIHLGLLWSLFALGDLELGRADPAAALAQYERLNELLGSVGVLDPDLSPAPELVEVYLRLGRADEAAEAARTFAVRAREKGQPWALARAARASALVASDDAEGLFEEALGWHERTLDVFETARTRLVYGAWLRRSRRRVDARTQLRLAVSAFDQLGAPAWADQAANELKATGETARRREPSTADALTPQERQIALILADGQSIREAAARLFLSPKTVEYHLRKVYAKLGIHTRTALTTALQDHP